MSNIKFHEMSNVMKCQRSNNLSTCQFISFLICELFSLSAFQLAHLGACELVGFQRNVQMTKHSLERTRGEKSCCRSRKTLICHSPTVYYCTRTMFFGERKILRKMFCWQNNDKMNFCRSHILSVQKYFLVEKQCCH